MELSIRRFTPTNVGEHMRQVFIATPENVQDHANGLVALWAYAKSQDIIDTYRTTNIHDYAVRAALLRLFAKRLIFYRVDAEHVIQCADISVEEAERGVAAMVLGGVAKHLDSIYERCHIDGYACALHAFQWFDPIELDSPHLHVVWFGERDFLRDIDRLDLEQYIKKDDDIEEVM